MLDFCKAKVRELGGNIITIGIVEENTILKDWYAANGFVHTGIKKFDHQMCIRDRYKTALVVQALKALGKSNVTDKELRSISKLLTENEKAQMLVEAKRVTAWVYELMRKICKEDV